MVVGGRDRLGFGSGLFFLVGVSGRFGQLGSRRNRVVGGHPFQGLMLLIVIAGLTFPLAFVEFGNLCSQVNLFHNPYYQQHAG